jgi:DNA-binding XRE family transcriptional regulator
MDLKNISEKFGMNVKEFAQTIGYTRQALYQVATDKNNINRNRLNTAISLLQMINDAEYRKDIEAATKRKVERERAINELRENFKR